MRDPDRWFATGESGFRRLFEVWGDEPAPVTRIPLRRAATRPMALVADDDVVAAVLAAPERPRRRVDPRTLWASQHGVTQGGIRYYLDGSQYRSTGRPWADQWSRVNREVVVWGPAPDGPQLLSGHHRTVAALLRGEEIDVVWVDPSQPTVAPGVRVTPDLWIGTPSVRPFVSEGTDIVESDAAARRVLEQRGVDGLWVDSLLGFARHGRVM